MQVPGDRGLYLWGLCAQVAPALCAVPGQGQETAGGGGRGSLQTLAAARVEQRLAGVRGFQVNHLQAIS